MKCKNFITAHFLWKEIINQQFDFKSDFYLQADSASQGADFLLCLSFRRFQMRQSVCNKALTGVIERKAEI